MLESLNIIIAQTAIKLDPLPRIGADNARIQTILTVVFTIVGAISLLVITVAGFKYVVSHGDPNVIAQAKNTIVYALIGLVVSIAAIGIVNFVVGRLA